jgi:hypothetical protein
MATCPGATFGNGVEVVALNEAGGREVVIFNELSVQFAYLMCLHRYRPVLIKNLCEIAHSYVETIRCDRGRIGQGARIFSTKEILDLNVGPHAVIDAAASLVNGTILSSAEAPTLVGSNVVAEDFIIAEGTSVTGTVNLKKVYIGQGCRIGNQFSAENSLFFANCEAFLGEACSVFAGPYTVSHHKSTLLIACLLSFYNAGSGTNQSNHMYKLGPKLLQRRQRNQPIQPHVQARPHPRGKTRTRDQSRFIFVYDMALQGWALLCHTGQAHQKF